jgi:hypothetical protein
MICETLREVLVDLERRGNLIRAAKRVDVGWEVACLVKWILRGDLNDGGKPRKPLTFAESECRLLPRPGCAITQSDSE